jgi:hypothetical protein
LILKGVEYIKRVEYCINHVDDLADTLIDWLDDILSRANIHLSNKALDEEREMLINYFNGDQEFKADKS